GLVCHAPSEWDSTNNEGRYARLLDEGGFYHGNEKGYRDFLKYLKEVQFWDKTGIPAGQKLWFFHPLEFIRHFRRCGWLDLREQIQLLPRSSMPDAGGDISWAESNKRFTEGNSDARGESPRRMWLALNHVYRKYGLGNGSLRRAHFLGQVLKETGALCSTRENGNAEYFRKMYESYSASDAAFDFDNKNAWLGRLGFLKGRDRATYIAQRPAEVQSKAIAGENIKLGDGPRFCGRGLIHLTWRKGYREYGEYCLDSSFKCNTLDEVGCCNDEIPASERRRARGDHDREDQKHERQGDCKAAWSQRVDDHARTGTQSYGIVSLL
ncbi:hypothetical protein, partial [Burkholderia sp. Bp9031]|uniref:hypothetical protein n=1 Tax=Burkholderia sp. Bp9031 TaxID=2184566 RepID=UPI0021AB98B7